MFISSLISDASLAWRRFIHSFGSSFLARTDRPLHTNRDRSCLVIESIIYDKSVVYFLTDFARCLHKSKITKVSLPSNQGVLCKALMCGDPKSAKRHWSLDCLFSFLESVQVKAACKMLVKLTPGVDPTKLFFFANEEFFRFLLVSLHFCYI